MPLPNLYSVGGAGHIALAYSLLVHLKFSIEGTKASAFLFLQTCHALSSRPCNHYFLTPHSDDLRA